METTIASSSSLQSQASIDKIRFAYQDLKQRYVSVFQSGSIPTLNELRSHGLSGQLASSDAPLRSIYWQLYFSHLPLQDPSSWPLLLTRQRFDYSQNRKKRLRAPDGNYPPETGLGPEQDLELNNANVGASLSRAGTVVKDLRVNNPLSLDEETPWKSHYASKDLRATISTDVERAFPDHHLFRLPEVQRSLSNLILVWCLMNPAIGYRQGIHELAAAVWYVRTRESVKLSQSSTIHQKDPVDRGLEAILDEKYVEHDAFAILNAIMQNAKGWYEWRERPQASSRPGDIASPVPAPIVVKCERIHATLKVVDPALASHLESLSIEPQLYALRWVRLMFTREFQLEDALQIWDGIFSEDVSLSLVDFICLAMLERIRSKLLSSDYSESLQILLRYPTQASAASLAEGTSKTGGGDHPSLLVQQALRLRELTSPTTGVEIVYQNRDVMGIPLHTAAATTSSPINTLDLPLPSKRNGLAYTVATGRSHGQRAPLPRLNSAQSRNSPNLNADLNTEAFPGSAQASSGAQRPTSPIAFAASSYLPEGLSGLARGIYERSDALGINKALVSSLSNVQRTVEAYAARNQAENLGEGGPFIDGAEESVRARRAALNQSGASVLNPTPQATSQVPQNPELAALKESNKAMGAAVAACVEVFERQWVLNETSSLATERQKRESSAEEEKMNTASVETLMSLCAMKHIRDVLLGVATDFDPAILGSPERHDESPERHPSSPPIPQKSDTLSQGVSRPPSSSSPVKSSFSSQSRDLARHRAFSRVEDSNSKPPSSSPSVFASYQISQAPSSGSSRSARPLHQTPKVFTSHPSSEAQPSSSGSSPDSKGQLRFTSNPTSHSPEQRHVPQSPFLSQQQSPRSSSISSSSFVSHAGTVARRDSAAQRASIMESNRSHSNLSSYPPMPSGVKEPSKALNLAPVKKTQSSMKFEFEGSGSDPLGAS